MVSFYLKSNLKQKNFLINKKKITFFNFLGKRYNGEFVLLTFLKNVIFGLNLKRFLKFFCFFLGCSFSLKINFLPIDKLQLLQKFLFISRINNNLKKIINVNLHQKKKFNLYMGIRQKLNLPSRGQRSKTNAKNSKKRKNLLFLFEKKTIKINNINKKLNKNKMQTKNKNSTKKVKKKK
jgi:small subunit ribosomal protein S13